MSTTLETDELVRLVRSVFHPDRADRSLALMADLPDEELADHDEWRERRELVVDWHRRLDGARRELGLEVVGLVFYRNVRRNNADLPIEAWIDPPNAPPSDASSVKGPTTPFAEVFSSYRLLLAATELSATAPLKLQAPRYGFRAATMPGFTRRMIPALRLDYEEIHRRCLELKRRLDESVAAQLCFEAGGRTHELRIDLRHRQATASGGLLRKPGVAGNLPSGETYIVPYKGEIEGDASRTSGMLPLEMDGELLFYRIEANRVVEVLGDGPVAGVERKEMAEEPAYANVAELGLGLLADYGVRPVGRLLLDEKLGLHIAFGRSDHFGGQVGAADFSSRDRVVHIDRVYLPQVQPRVRVVSVNLERASPAGGQPIPAPLMRDGRYV